MSRWRQAVRCTDVIVAVVAIILAAVAIILAALSIVVLPRPCSSSYVTRYHAQRAGTPAEASSSCDCPRSRYPQHLILSAYLEESGTSKARDVWYQQSERRQQVQSNTVSCPFIHPSEGRKDCVRDARDAQPSKLWEWSKPRSPEVSSLDETHSEVGERPVTSVTRTKTSK